MYKISSFFNQQNYSCSKTTKYLQKFWNKNEPFKIPSICKMKTGRLHFNRTYIRMRILYFSRLRERMEQFHGIFGQKTCMLCWIIAHSWLLILWLVSVEFFRWQLLMMWTLLFSRWHLLISGCEAHGYSFLRYSIEVS